MQEAGELGKCPTGIRGLDEITGGGLPRGRTALVCGGPGCGKTFLAMEFLVHGAEAFGEPGVFFSFEESEAELKENFRSLGFDLQGMVEARRLAFDHVHIERSEVIETGDFDLEALFLRIEDAVETVGARRIALDTMESLFSTLPNETVIRSELRRLFRWLKEKGLLTVRSIRPTHLGLESHLMEFQDEILRLDPAHVAFDPLSDLINAGERTMLRSM